MSNINLGNIEIPIIKPEKGVDYYTEIEKEELIEEVKRRVNTIIEPNEQQRSQNEELRISNETTRQSNEQQRQTQEEQRQSAEQLRQEAETERETSEQARQQAEETRQAQELERETLHSQQTQEMSQAISQIEDMTENYNANAEQKTQDFNNNYETKNTAFNNNATNKTTDYNNNAETKTNAFNSNVSEKINAYNTNSETKINEFNSNATAKIEDFNNNAESYEKKAITQIITITSKVNKETNYELPLSYIVGNNSLRIFWKGVLLECGQDGNYIEVGNSGELSNIVQFGWDLEIGDVLTIEVRGVVDEE